MKNVSRTKRCTGILAVRYQDSQLKQSIERGGGGGEAVGECNSRSRTWALCVLFPLQLYNCITPISLTLPVFLSSSPPLLTFFYSHVLPVSLFFFLFLSFFLPVSRSFSLSLSLLIPISLRLSHSPSLDLPTSLQQTCRKNIA